MRPGGTRKPRASSVPRRPFASFDPHAGAPGDLRGLLAAMRRYVEHRGVLGGTEQSLYNTERFVREFIAWADERGVTHPSQVSRAVLERYQRHLYHQRKRDGEPLSVATRRAKLAPLKGFFKWLTRSGEIGANPASELELPRAIKRLPRNVMSAEEAEAVLAGVDIGSVLGLRDRAMLEVLYATGMRRTELARLALGDIDPQRALVLIRLGKGLKDRLIPLGERALYWVGEYLERARPQLAWNADDSTLFLGCEGKPLQPQSITVMVAKRIQAGTAKRGSCHMWRHTMATLMLEGGADIRYIQAMLGHADIASTQIYTQVAVKQLQAVHALTHPGVSRRVRGEGGENAENDARAAQTAADVSEPAPDRQSAAEALLAALDAEAQEEASEDQAGSDDGGGVAADALRRR